MHGSRSISPPCEALITATMGGHQIRLRHSGLLRAQQPRERPTPAVEELQAAHSHHSPLPPPHATQTTQCSASAPPRAPRLRCPLSATPLPAAGLLASARRALRALPTTPSTVRGPLLNSTLLTPLVSAYGGGGLGIGSRGGGRGCEDGLEDMGGRERNGMMQEQEQGN